MIYNIFIDGSYTKSSPNLVCGGVVLVVEDKPVSMLHIESKAPEFTSMNNVGGELLAALIGASYIIKIVGTFNAEDTVIFNYDYEGIACYLGRGRIPWQAARGATKAYKAKMNEFINRIPAKVIFNKVKAHAGVRWNEAVDLVAKGYIPNGYEAIYSSFSMED